MLHISFFNILVQVDLVNLCARINVISIWLARLLLWRVVRSTQVNHSIQIIKDWLDQMIIFQLSILVLQIPMIYAQPDQTDRFHRGLLWKRSWYPIQKYIFAGEKGKGGQSNQLQTIMHQLCRLDIKQVDYLARSKCTALVKLVLHASIVSSLVAFLASYHTFQSFSNLHFLGFAFFHSKDMGSHMHEQCSMCDQYIQ